MIRIPHRSTITPPSEASSVSVHREQPWSNHKPVTPPETPKRSDGVDTAVAKPWWPVRQHRSSAGIDPAAAYPYTVSRHQNISTFTLSINFDSESASEKHLGLIDRPCLKSISEVIMYTDSKCGTLAPELPCTVTTSKEHYSSCSSFSHRSAAPRCSFDSSLRHPWRGSERSIRSDYRRARGCDPQLPNGKAVS